MAIKYRLPCAAAHLRWKQEIDNWIGSRIEWCKALNQGGERDARLGPFDLAKYLKQIEYDVRRPTNYKYWNKRKTEWMAMWEQRSINLCAGFHTYNNDNRHFDGFNFGTWNNTSGTGSSTSSICKQIKKTVN